MKNYQRLLAISKKFANELRQSREDLIAVRTTENFEDSFVKKLSELTLYSSKLRLLNANVSLATSQPPEPCGDKESVEKSYGDTDAARIIESQMVKSVAQIDAVTELLTAPDSTLTPETLQRKKDIIEAISAYEAQETVVRQLDKTLKEREEELLRVQQEWDKEMGLLRDMMQEKREQTVDTDDPMYQRLSAIVNKLRKMCWLAGRLGLAGPANYDWLADPQNRLKAIKLARKHYTVEMFLKD